MTDRIKMNKESLIEQLETLKNSTEKGMRNALLKEWYNSNSGK